MAKIKIKFKDIISSDVFSIDIDFLSNGVSYNHMSANGKIQLLYNSTIAFNGEEWNNTNYQYIEIDPTQANFQAFITAMKSNIEGVELEAGTYKWVDEPNIDGIEVFSNHFTFSSNDVAYNSINVGTVRASPVELTYAITYAPVSGQSTNAYVLSSGTWADNAYKAITTTSNQYIDYDFYNYAILGNQLVKQETEITYTCKWYLDGTLVNTSTFTHSELSGVDYNVNGSVFQVMLSAATLAQYDYGVNLDVENSSAVLGSDNVITIEAVQGNIVFNITSNGKTTLATKNTYVNSDIDFNVNVPSGSSLLDITATFKVENSNYQITSIKSGNKITRPYADPTISGKSFQGWFDASSGGNKVSFPLSATSDQDIYAQFIDTTIATVSGLGSGNISNVTFDVPSDFKFTDGEFTDSDGNVFVKIPKMYRKINATSDGQITSFSISNAKIDDDYKLYPVFLAEDGTTELDWVGIGRGMNSSTTKLNTSATSSAKASISLSQGRISLANYYNSNYQLYDWMFHKLWQDLIICKMQTININTGSGIQQDQLGIYWGGTGTMIDGFGHVDSYVYLCDKPSKYVDSPTASSDGYFTTSYRIATTGGEIQKLGYDEMHPFVNLPTAVISKSNYDTYYCDYYSYNSGNCTFYCGVGYADALFGAFYLYGRYDWTGTDGVRLCYRPLA